MRWGGSSQHRSCGGRPKSERRLHVVLVIARRQRPSYWLLTRLAAGQLDVLKVGSPGGEEVLPVFSFDDEAQMFVRLAALEGAWGARETSTGEMISVLYGPCGGVTRVALDPIPEPGPAAFRGASFGRGGFLSFLSRRQETAGSPRHPQLVGSATGETDGISADAAPVVRRG